MIGDAGDLPNQRQSFPWRVLDRILHPIARRRRTAAHRRVLHRQRHTGLVTGVPSDRFELTEHNRKMLGLDRGPPGSRVRGQPVAADPDPAVERGHPAEWAGGVLSADDAGSESGSAPGLKTARGDSRAQAVSPQVEREERGDTVRPDLCDLGQRDDPGEPSE